MNTLTQTDQPLAMGPQPIDRDEHDHDHDMMDDKKGGLAEDEVVVAPSLYDQNAILEEEDKVPAVTKRELWSYYFYYQGNCGTGPNGYAPTQFQNLMSQASYSMADGPSGAGQCKGDSAHCFLPFGSGERSVSSVFLLANGISFAIMTLGFTTFGGLQDYKTYNRWFLLGLTIVCWASSFGFLGLKDAGQWRIAMALYMIGYITYGATLVFYAAIFPRLARALPEERANREELRQGTITHEEFEKRSSLNRNMVSSISTAHSNWGYLLTLSLNLAILLPLASSNQVNNYVIALCTVYWVILGVPWFIFQKTRPGPDLPAGSNVLTVGWQQILVAIKEIKRLPQTFIYLGGFFLLADGLNTTGTMVGIVQNNNISFSFLEFTYLGLVQAGCSVISLYAMWYIQKWFRLETKVMFTITNVFTCLIPLWGMIGMWTDKIGFHNRWEFYMYNAVFGLFQAPYYAYSQTMLSELLPPGFEGTFFSLFGLTNRASSIIGPNVLSAIISASGNNYTGFAFLFALCTVATIILVTFVDVKKGRADALSYAERKRAIVAQEMVVE